MQLSLKERKFIFLTDVFTAVVVVLTSGPYIENREQPCPGNVKRILISTAKACFKVLFLFRL